MFYILFLIATATRLMPHPPNLVCVGAIGLFAGCYLRGRTAWLLPIGAMLASDVIGHVLRLPGMGFYNPAVFCMVYAGIAASALIGRGLAKNRTAARIGGAAVASSIVFFLASNLGVWFAGQYPPTVAGLIACYTMALPFLTNTLIGNLLYSAVLFGTYEFSQSQWPARLTRLVSKQPAMQPAFARKS